MPPINYIFATTKTWLLSLIRNIFRLFRDVLLQFTTIAVVSFLNTSLQLSSCPQPQTFERGKYCSCISKSRVGKSGTFPFFLIPIFSQESDYPTELSAQEITSTALAKNTTMLLTTKPFLGREKMLKNTTICHRRKQKGGLGWVFGALYSPSLTFASQVLLGKMDRNLDEQIDRKELYAWILRSFK